MKDREEEKDFFEQRSLENLLLIYRQELLRIVGGELCSKVLPKSVRLRLRRNGILTKVGHTFGVTVKGMKMLDEEAV